MTSDVFTLPSRTTSTVQSGGRQIVQVSGVMTAAEVTCAKSNRLQLMGEGRRGICRVRNQRETMEAGDDLRNDAGKAPGRQLFVRAGCQHRGWFIHRGSGASIGPQRFSVKPM